ncbi:HNH endonuclease [Lentilactobacillus kisonensis]|uniref:Uncharacterized protein n=1 Tax=Lentilactobacillus kisonensis DSM 19906 = JCM 15041 TaxID=1423766 RepID=A0A0R1NQI5_9LACO|nr:HNH endonuclease [Lentilactobacillus kisonensis]KRL18883.1 hypothetical protein FC98_GL002301 [Lentilactobacillus kisonensis DSM 19906 = JCM 15041]
MSSCKIKLTGKRNSDFVAANTAAHIATKPLGYTWHHLYDLNFATPANDDQSWMQLVSMPMHRRSCPHLGSAKQWVDKHHTPYKLGLSSTGETFADNEFLNTNNSNEIIDSVESSVDLIRGLHDHKCVGPLSPSDTLYVPTIYDWYRVGDYIKLIKDQRPELVKHGVLPLGEDAFGNVLWWQQTGRIAEGNIYYIQDDVGLDSFDDNSIVSISIKSDNVKQFIQQYVKRAL